MISIRVDLNRRGRNGYVISSAKRATEPVAAGTMVRIYQPGEDFDLTAEVVSISPEGRLELDVNWPPREIPEARGAWVSVISGRTPHSADLVSDRQRTLVPQPA